MVAPQPAGDMLGAGGTCEFKAPTECRRPASTSVTGFCACLPPAASPETGITRHPTGDELEHGELGAARAPGAGVCRQAKPTKPPAASRCPWRSAGDIERAQGRMPGASVRRRGMGSPERRGHLAPRRLKTCGHFITRGHLATGMGSPERRGHLALRRLKTCGHFITCGHFSPSHAAAFIRASFRSRFRSAFERCRCSCSDPSVYSVSPSSSMATAGS